MAWQSLCFQELGENFLLWRSTQAMGWEGHVSVDIFRLGDKFVNTLVLDTVFLGVYKAVSA